MKRISILLFSSALLLSSCHTVTRTSRTAEVGSSLQSATVVDIVPATEHRITYTLEPSKALQRGGADNIKQAAEAEALAKYGNADILLEPRYMITKQKGLLRSKITSISVSGRPAYYTNFRTLDDSVWCNPAFRGMEVRQPRPMPLPGKFNPILAGKLGGMKKKRSVPNTQAFRSKGLAVYVSPFIGMKGVNESYHSYYGGYRDEYNTYLSGGLLVSAGYQLNPHFFVGAGTGMDFYGDIGSIPIYAQARINLSKKANTWFVEGKYGTDLWTPGGAFSGLSIGYSFGNIDVAYQYLYHECYYNYDSDCNQWGLSIGMRF